MDSTTAFLLLMKFCIVLIAMIFILCFGITIFKERKICDEVGQEMDNCTMELVQFGFDYQKWEESNFSCQDPTQVADLKAQCENVPSQKCSSPGSPSKSDCQNHGNLTESMPFWCRRIDFFSGDFAKCAGKINQLAGSSKCAGLFFRVAFIEKASQEKCAILNANEDCILEKVNKTCAKAMAGNLKTHLESEKSNLGC